MSLIKAMTKYEINTVFQKTPNSNFDQIRRVDKKSESAIE